MKYAALRELARAGKVPSITRPGVRSRWPTLRLHGAWFKGDEDDLAHDEEISKLLKTADTTVGKRNSAEDICRGAQADREAPIWCRCFPIRATTPSPATSASPPSRMNCRASSRPSGNNKRTARKRQRDAMRASRLTAASAVPSSGHGRTVAASSGARMRVQARAATVVQTPCRMPEDACLHSPTIGRRLLRGLHRLGDRLRAAAHVRRYGHRHRRPEAPRPGGRGAAHMGSTAP